ncbi:Aorsin [Arthrobotrys entomopaga]|nr:Aorsin [Arthrobotrys entomopaga]
MRIGLKQRNVELGHNLFVKISTPDSPSYGNHLTTAEVIELFAPSKESEQAVLQWIYDFGIHEDRVSISWNRQWIQFDARVSEAEVLLHTNYHIYEHGPSGRLNVACEKYHTSTENKAETKCSNNGTSDTNPATWFWLTANQKILNIVREVLVAVLSASLPCSLTNPIAITPKCVRELYNIKTLNTTTQVNPNNKMGIFQSLGQLYSASDIDTFNTLFTGIPIGNTTPELRSIDGGPGGVAQLTDRAGDESNLDVQASHHIIYPQGQVVYSTDDKPTQNNYTYPGFLNNYLDGIDGSYFSFAAFGITGNSNTSDNAITSTLDPPYPNPANAGKLGAYPGPLDCGTQKPSYVTAISYGGAENVLQLPANYQRR